MKHALCVLSADGEIIDERFVPNRREELELLSERAIKNNNTSYKIMHGYYAELQECFVKAGIVVWNCTQGSKLEALPFMELAKAVQQALADVNGSTRGMYAVKSG